MTVSPKRDFFRLALSLLLAAGAVSAIALPLRWLVVAVLAASAAHVLLGRRRLRSLGAGIPVLLFAATLVLLQWLGGRIDLSLPLRTVAVFLLSTLAASVAPWTWIAGGVSPGSRLYLPGLFLLFIRHFAGILISESRRTLQARALSAPRVSGPGGFASVTGALTAVFRRALVRAERFYAAQLLNEIVR
ncbi:MAG: hypothetical protein ACE141_08885 [Bryobacteraceae bacterium]